jgi:hypothetical protein
MIASDAGTQAMSEYETDILVWSERQADLLRRRAAGELVNEADLDWSNIAEEIEAVGSEQLHAVTSLLAQVLLHMLKADAWPRSRDVPHWRAEARRFRDDAADRFAPSMRQRIDMVKLYRRASGAARDDGRRGRAAGAPCLPRHVGRAAERGGLDRSFCLPWLDS